MQARAGGSDSRWVKLKHREARGLLPGDLAEYVLQAGAALGVLDEDDRGGRVFFPHHLWQEHFAARRLAEAPEPDRVRVAWREGEVRPSLAETVAAINPADPLPSPTPRREETTAAVAMTRAHVRPAPGRGQPATGRPLCRRR